MDSMLFLEGDALSEVVTCCGQYAAAGLGFALVCWLLGYVVWWVIDLCRGGVV